MAAACLVVERKRPLRLDSFVTDNIFPCWQHFSSQFPPMHDCRSLTNHWEVTAYTKQVQVGDAMAHDLPRRVSFAVDLKHSGEEVFLNPAPRPNIRALCFTIATSILLNYKHTSTFPVLSSNRVLIRLHN